MFQLKALLILLVLALQVAECRSKGVVNVDLWTWRKVLQSHRSAVVKFDVEFPHGHFQEQWLQFVATYSNTTTIERSKKRRTSSPQAQGGIASDAEVRSVLPLLVEMRTKEDGSSPNLPLMRTLGIHVDDGPQGKGVGPAQPKPSTSGKPLPRQNETFPIIWYFHRRTDRDRRDHPDPTPIPTPLPGGVHQLGHSRISVYNFSRTSPSSFSASSLARWLMNRVAEDRQLILDSISLTSTTTGDEAKLQAPSSLCILPLAGASIERSLALIEVWEGRRTLEETESWIGAEGKLSETKENKKKAAMGDETAAKSRQYYRQLLDKRFPIAPAVAQREYGQTDCGEGAEHSQGDEGSCAAANAGAGSLTWRSWVRREKDRLEQLLQISRRPAEVGGAPLDPGDTASQKEKVSETQALELEVRLNILSSLLYCAP